MPWRISWEFEELRYVLCSFRNVMLSIDSIFLEDFISKDMISLAEMMDELRFGIT